MNSFLLDGLLFPAIDILVSRMNPYLNYGGLVPTALNKNFWQPLKMEQDLPL